MKPDRLKRQLKRYREKKRMESAAHKMQREKGSTYSEADSKRMRELLKVKKFRLEMLGQEPERGR